jgi:hypothetical protein
MGKENKEVQMITIPESEYFELLEYKFKGRELFKEQHDAARQMIEEVKRNFDVEAFFLSQGILPGKGR